MAQDTAPILARKRRFAFEIETTTGTYETLAAADGVTPIEADPTTPLITYGTEVVNRENTETLSKKLQYFGAQSAGSVFRQFMYGSGSSGSLPHWTKLLMACGFAESGGVFTPITGEVDTLSFLEYRPGYGTKYVVGAQGNAVFRGRRGEPMAIDWTFTGKRKAPDATTISAPTYDTTIPPRCAGGTLTLASTTYRIDEIEIDLGNVVILREDLTDATGYRSAYITDRAPIVRLALESVAIATKDWYAAHLASTTTALAWTIGSTANNTFAWAMPKMQLVTDPNEGDRNGMLTNVLEFQMSENATTGDDEMSLTLT